MDITNTQLRNNHFFMDQKLDTFSKIHEGKHILFIGDSFAAGDGLSLEDTWCYKVYNKISDKEKTSGYYNIGMSGASIYESIDIFFRYCSDYTNPDVVFFVTTEIHRDGRYFNTKFLETISKRMYFYLEQYCESNNIQLYSFSWVKSVDLYSPEPKRYTMTFRNHKEEDEDIVRPLWIEQGNQNQNDFDADAFIQFKTFYDYSVKDMLSSVFKYDKKSKTPEKSLWAKDDVHPGTSFHDFYAEFIHQKYLENNK
jgi:hypothetical protein